MRHHARVPHVWRLEAGGIEAVCANCGLRLVAKAYFASHARSAPRLKTRLVLSATGKPYDPAKDQCEYDGTCSV